MTPATSEPEREPRVAIWSLSARVVGAYFAIYLLQYVPSVAFEAYIHFQQRAADETLARVMVEVIKASGPIGIGSATNAAAIAMLMEAVMVLASIISEQKRKEGFRQGVKQGIEQGVKQGIEQGVKVERKRSNAKMRALAEKYGIPEDELPIEPEHDDA